MRYSKCCCELSLVLYFSDENTGQAKLLISRMLCLTAECGVFSAPFTALKLSPDLRAAKVVGGQPGDRPF